MHAEVTSSLPLIISQYKSITCLELKIYKFSEGNKFFMTLELGNQSIVRNNITQHVFL